MAFAISLCVVSPGRAQILYTSNFEAGAAGWSSTRTETHPAYSRYMGRFDDNPSQTSRSFTVPANTQSLRIEFDFYRFDSWDDTVQWGFDRFEVDINSAQIFSLPMSPQPASLTGSNGNASWTFTPISSPANLAYDSYEDQTFRVVIIIANPPATVTLTLRTDVNQGDESGGFDNMQVRAIPNTPLVSVQKSSQLATGGSGYHLPGEDIVYTIDIISTGAALDSNSLVVSDVLPPALSLFTGNYAGSGVTVRLTDLSSPPAGIACCTAAMLAYSTSISGPAVYGYTPNGSYDPAITHLQIRPTGMLREGVTAQVHIRLEFLAKID